MPQNLLSHFDKDRSILIKAIQHVQKEEGYISNDQIRNLADYFDIPLVDVEGVITFYTQFKRTKPGKYIVHVCDGTACHIKGSELIANWISEILGIADGETDEEGLFSLETVACLGCCSLAPVIAVNGKVYGNLDRKQLRKVLRTYQMEAKK
ncbi:MAG: NADH-quinone oxidoreductase subunit NuoE [Candidatus Marinimicrobia bacterium]|nr:NADH-quinone oxidoreductase subunit NuoE [Candidatus Neomarinimicrobiota bacterium]